MSARAPSACSRCFELGLLDLKSHLVDILDRPGGQCTELYPEKPIYDIPGLPDLHRPGADRPAAGADQAVRAQSSISARWRQSLDKTADGHWQLTTDAGTELIAPVVVIAAGGGSFVPKRPPIPGIEAYEGTGVFYAVRKMEQFRGKNIVIAGGGDSALDWTLNLAPVAQSLTLVHHRDGFRAAQHSVAPDARAGGARQDQVRGRQPCRAQGTRRQARRGCRSSGPTATLIDIEADALLPFFGLTIKLGPIADFGLNLNENLIPVDTAKFETATPGIFAIGDINTYPGKLKLILSGFHEAALMAQAAFRYVPAEREAAFPVHDVVVRAAAPAEGRLTMIVTVHQPDGTQPRLEASRAGA